MRWQFFIEYLIKMTGFSKPTLQLRDSKPSSELSLVHIVFFGEVPLIVLVIAKHSLYWTD